MKLLLWGVVIFAVVMWLLHMKKSAIRRDSSDHANPPPAKDVSEPMIRCAQCGIHIPASEAILVRPDLAFCSEEHRLKHSSR